MDEPLVGSTTINGALTFPVLHSCLGQVGREELDPYKTEDMQGIRPLPKSDSEQLDLSIYLFMHSLFCMFQFTFFYGVLVVLLLRLVTSGFMWLVTSTFRCVLHGSW